MKYFLYGMLIVGVALSLIAGIYSISGLTVIFKGAYFATILMATCMEMAKVSISVYLHIFWKKMNKLLLVYLTFALVILMIITSIGIYGYLSKSYLMSTDTSVSADKVSSFEMLVNIEREKIKTNSEVIASLQKTPVEERSSYHTSRVLSLSREIENASKKIESLNKEIMPEKTKISTMTMEVGPLKYVALIIFDSEGKEAIDKAVQILIVMLVCVFDPLAILLILASIQGLEIFRRDHMSFVKPKQDKPTIQPEDWVSEFVEAQETHDPIKEENKKVMEEILPSDTKSVIDKIQSYIPKIKTETTEVKNEKKKQKKESSPPLPPEAIQKVQEHEKLRFSDIGNFRDIQEIYEKFPVLKKASIQSAKVSIDRATGKLHWHDGIFFSGIFPNGGVVHDGVFKRQATILEDVEFKGGVRE